MGKLGIENFLLEIFFVLPLVFHRECFENARRCLCRLECIVVDRSPSLRMRGYPVRGVYSSMRHSTNL